MTRDVAMSQWRGRCGRQKRATREAEGLDCSVLTSLWESAEQVVCVFMILCEMFADGLRGSGQHSSHKVIIF